MNKTNLLIVDDDPSLLKLLSIRLKAANYNVSTASSGREALSKLPVVQPQLIITDLCMEGMDGLALFEEVQSQYASLPVIILTAHGTIPDAVAATRKGVFSYLTKPFDAKQLLRTIENALVVSTVSTKGDGGENNVWKEAILTQSALMEELLSQAYRSAQTNVGILIQSESGTGKELVARAIHKASPRKNAPFIPINCAAIPEALLESELFGHKKGAFTGAEHAHDGLFVAAQGGTLFLDEIGDMPIGFQSKLLRVLQDKNVRPVGSTEARPVDVRIIAATHQDLEKNIKKGTFREDLYYRLNVVILELPALCKRREDIPLLARHFLAEQQKNSSICSAKSFSPEAMEVLMAAPWPGNIRQLQNVIEQLAVISTTALVPANLVEKALRGKTGKITPLAEAQSGFEREYLVKVLQMTHGNVTQAARLARRNRTEFYRLLSRHHLEPELFREA